MCLTRHAYVQKTEIPTLETVESQQNVFAEVQTFGTVLSNISKLFDMQVLLRRLRAHMNLFMKESFDANLRQT